MSTKLTGGRLSWIDVLRGLAILAVVLHHAELQVSIGLDTRLGIITTMDEAIGPFRMPLLMFLSGILLPLSLAKPYGTYLQGKFRKIAWPYLVWSFAYLGILVAAAPLRGESVNIGEFAKVFYAPPTYHWYLAYLVVFYIVALLLARVPWVRVATIPFALVGAILVGGEWERLLFLWAFFMAGDAVASHWERLKPIITHPVTVIICTLATIWVMVVAGSGAELRYDPLWAVGICAAVFALRPLMVALAPTRIGTALAAVGRQSLVYYVSHYLIITLSFHVLTRAGVSNAVALFFLTSAISLLVGYVLVLLRRYPLVNWIFIWAPRDIHAQVEHRGLQRQHHAVNTSLSAPACDINSDS